MAPTDRATAPAPKLFLALAIGLALHTGCASLGGPPPPVTATWHHRGSAPIHRVLFATPQLGWATTYGSGDLLRTEDGGRTWEVSAELGSEYFESLQFLDERTGFVAGDYGYIYRTEDGGQTWREISPELEQRIIEPYRSRAADDPRPPPPGIYAAYYTTHFFDRDHGFTTGFQTRPSDPDARFEPTRLETRDGGESWSPIDEERLGQLETLLDEGADRERGGFVGSTFRLGTDRAWTLNGRRREPNLELRRTHEGSDEVTEVSLPVAETWIGRKVWFFDGRRGLVAGGQMTRADGQVTFGDAVLLISRDGGGTWQRLATELPAIHDFDVVDQTLWIVGQEGMIASLPIARLFGSRR